MSEITSVTCEPTMLENIQCVQFGTCISSAEAPILPYLNVKWVLCCITQGRGVVQTREAETELHEGMLLCVFPDQLVRIRTTGELACRWIQLDGTAVPGLLRVCGLTERTPAVLLSCESCEELFIRLADDITMTEMGRLGVILTLFDALQSETARPFAHKAENLQQQYVDRAISYMQKNYAKDISVEDVAEYCGLNRSYLGKLFRDSLGITTQEYLIRTRMEAACRYLAMGAAPIGVISRSVGYPNQLHFSRAFRKVFGIPPREWQKKHRIGMAPLPEDEEA